MKYIQCNIAVYRQELIIQLSDTITTSDKVSEMKTIDESV